MFSGRRHVDRNVIVLGDPTCIFEVEALECWSLAFLWLAREDRFASTTQ